MGVVSQRIAAGGVALGLVGALAVMAPGRAATSPVPNIAGNWAGYVTSGSGITSVTGAWTVPNAGTLPPGVSATWVGIGGFNSTDLIQAGTQESSPPDDQIFTGGSYSAWYEMLPANPVYLAGCSGDPTCAVHPGDQMSATVSNGGSGTTWTISVSDANHWSYSTRVCYSSSESSAEWIDESPSAGGAVPVPMGNSGTVTFDGPSNAAVVNGASRTIGQSGASAWIALPGETAVSPLDSDGDGFNVCTYALSCSAPAT